MPKQIREFPENSSLTGNDLLLTQSGSDNTYKQFNLDDLDKFLETRWVFINQDSGAYEIQPRDKLVIDSQSGVNLTMPSAPEIGAEIEILGIGAENNNITIGSPSSSSNFTLEGETKEELTLDSAFQYFKLLYVNDTVGWVRLGSSYRPQPPEIPNSPNPSDGTTSISSDSDLYWAGNAPEYDVYFGETSPPPFVGTVNDEYYDLSIRAEKIYYWKIVARNDIGESNSPIWSFQTVATPEPRMTPVVTKDRDDASVRLGDIGFDFPLYGETYRNEIYVCSNSYITFGYSDTSYNGLSTEFPGVSLQITAADRSYQRVYTSTNNANSFRVRFEGHTNYQGGTAGFPTIVWEATLFSDGRIRIETETVEDTSGNNFITDGTGNNSTEFLLTANNGGIILVPDGDSFTVESYISWFKGTFSNWLSADYSWFYKSPSSGIGWFEGTFSKWTNANYSWFYESLGWYEGSLQDWLEPNWFN
jgi:hypothetical protein